MRNPELARKADDWLVEATFHDMQKAMDSGELTSKELVLMYMDRISRYDKGENGINSVLEINPDAVHIAEALDLERKQKGKRGPLHGIPILLKDNIDTHDKLHTSAGSLALKDHVASKDSFVAKKLREAGAVILGKANMTEWANFMTEHMPNGYSSRGGQVKNPYGPGTLDVGGSSSGSGASVAANLTAGAIGTETSGSILSPASSNSVVGIKPTVGLVSRTGIIPISHSQDTAGPIARTVEDAARILAAISGVDPEDPATLTNPSHSIHKTAFLNPAGLKGATIGVARDPYFSHLDDEEKSLMERAISIMKQEGATIIDPVEIPSAHEKWDLNTLIYEFKPALNAYLQQVESRIPVHSLEELIAFNEEHSEDMLKYGQTLLTKSEATSGTLTEAEYIQTREKDIYLSQTRGIDAVMEQHNLDVILFPNNLGAGIAAKAGYPSITVPGGYTSTGKPLGVTFTAKAFEEEKLIEVGYAFEQATRFRKPPELS
ncbi:MAG: amidase [Bacillaceae bacterium]|nr:amidase [Bacillaceae bacterium]